MKLLITGGSGFIGRNLKEQLEDRYVIFAPSSLELDLLDEDAVKSYLDRNRVDVVIHAATWDASRSSRKDLTKVLPYNLRMFYNIVRCSNLYDRLIVYGSGAEYDRNHWTPVMSEDCLDKHIPSDDYGFSKYIIAKQVQTARNIVELCLFGVFGKYEDWRIRFISNACCKAVNNMDITIKQNVLFDYLYIDDLVKITDWYIRNEAREKRYNVCTGEKHDLLELARKILKLSGRPLQIKIAREEMGREYSGDNSRLLTDIGGFEFSEIDASIKKLYYWYESVKDMIDGNELLTDR